MYTHSHFFPDEFRLKGTGCSHSRGKQTSQNISTPLIISARSKGREGQEGREREERGGKGGKDVKDAKKQDKTKVSYWYVIVLSNNFKTLGGNNFLLVTFFSLSHLTGQGVYNERWQGDSRGGRKGEAPPPDPPSETPPRMVPSLKMR